MTAHCWITTVPTSGEVQGLGPWRGLGQRPNLPMPQRQMVGAPAYNSTTAPIPRSGFVLGRRADHDATKSLSPLSPTAVLVVKIRRMGPADLADFRASGRVKAGTKRK